MREILEDLERWLADGCQVATGTVVAVDGSSPRGPGAVLAVNDRGEVAGSVSGGCVEGALVEECQAVLAGAPPHVVTYGVSDDDAFAVGLTCGGTFHIFVERLAW
jgi:xanthine dehydrogenase accessory factor